MVAAAAESEFAGKRLKADRLHAFVSASGLKGNDSNSMQCLPGLALAVDYVVPSGDIR